jgi:hypothetical protein
MSVDCDFVDTDNIYSIVSIVVPPFIALIYFLFLDVSRELYYC